MENLFLGLVIISLIPALCLDVMYFRLPNKFFWFLFYLFPIYVLATKQSHLVNAYLLFLIVLFLGYGLFLLGMIGGGDAKLTSALVLWIGWKDAPVFLLLVTFLGAMTGLIYLWQSEGMNYLSASGRQWVQRHATIQKMVHWFVPQASQSEEEFITLHQQRMVPYGVGVVLAAWIILLKRFW
jgi:Flp pilus assembly protein protease CpaA